MSLSLSAHQSINGDNYEYTITYDGIVKRSVDLMLIKQQILFLKTDFNQTLHEQRHHLTIFAKYRVTQKSDPAESVIGE